MRNIFKTISDNSTLQDVISWAKDVTRNRRFDVDDYDLQVASSPVIYPAPSSSSDLTGTEKVGDIAVDASYLYIVVDNSGTLEWKRVGVSSF